MLGRPGIGPLLAAILLAWALAPSAAGAAREPDGATAEGPAGGEPAARAAEEGHEPPIQLDTEAMDRKAGERAARELRESMGLLERPQLEAFLRRLGARLVTQAPPRRFDYEFHIVDQAVPNAFALPGGFVYVSRGLLALTDGEDEIAAVLAHEIAHVAARHAAAQQKVAQALPGPLRWLAVGELARYSRSQEQEADRLGQEIAARAGYDPAGLVHFLERLENAERLEFGGSRIPGFLDTHPSTRRRVAEAAHRARTELAGLPRLDPVLPDRTAYLRLLEGLPVGESADEGVFRGQLFVHPALRFVIRFPDGWETRNTPRAVGARDLRHRAQVFLELQGRGSDPAAAARAFLARPENRGLSVDRMEPATLGGSPAWRVIGRLGSSEGTVGVHLSFVAREGRIYRLTGAAVGFDRFRELIGLFHGVARSFRPAPPELLADVTELRLRLVAAVEGETLAELSQRAGNALDLDRTAVLNGLWSDARLAAGQLVKVAVAEPWRAPEGSSAP